MELIQGVGTLYPREYTYNVRRMRRDLIEHQKILLCRAKTGHLRRVVGE